MQVRKTGRLNVLLSRSGKRFEIVTRSRIQEILRERHLKYAENFDEKTFAEIGKLAGADSVVSGEYSVFSNRISVTVEVLDVSTGRIIGGEVLDLPRTSDMEALLTPPSRDQPQLSEHHATPTDSSPLGSSPSSKKGHAQPPVEEAGFVFEYPHCKVTSNAVNCWLLVKSPGKDQSMQVSALNGTESSFLYDQNGISYMASQATVGNITSTRVNYEYIRDIAVRMDLTFPVNRSITSIAALKLLCISKNRFIVPTFRDVPLD